MLLLTEEIFVKKYIIYLQIIQTLKSLNYVKATKCDASYDLYNKSYILVVVRNN